MSDLPPLPENVEKAVLAYGLKSQDFQVRLIGKCDLVTALEEVHRAVAAALLRAAADELKMKGSLHYSGRLVRIKSLYEQAAALEAGENR